MDWKAPKLAHLRPFGCIGYVHMKQGKLESRAMKAVFLGYPKGVKGYRLWLIDERKVVISRDVTFNEKLFFKTNLQVQNQKPDSFQFEVENNRDNELAGGSGVHSQATNLEDNQSGSDIEVIDGIADNTDLNDKEATLDNEQEEGQNLRHYMLARDRVRREIRPPPKYAHANVIAYALTIGDSIEISELVSFQEACNSK